MEITKKEIDWLCGSFNPNEASEPTTVVWVDTKLGALVATDGRMINVLLTDDAAFHDDSLESFAIPMWRVQEARKEIDFEKKEIDSSLFAPVELRTPFPEWKKWFPSFRATREETDGHFFFHPLLLSIAAKLSALVDDHTSLTYQPPTQKIKVGATAPHIFHACAKEVRRSKGNKYPINKAPRHYVSFILPNLGTFGAGDAMADALTAIRAERW